MMIATLLDRIDRYRALRVRQGSRYWEARADMPDTLYPYWKRTAHIEFKGIPRDALFFAHATEGLLTFFDCVRRSRKPCALPSKAADSVWHAWARLAPLQLHAFCVKHFGRAIPHVEGADMTAQMEEALATCLVQARQLESKPAAGMSVPRLFALDRKLGMPGGFGYRVASGQVAFQNMDALGHPAGDFFYPDSLTPVELLVAGHISQRQYDDYRARTAGSSCGASGSGCGSTACDGGGGSSCGGGCGGD